MITFSHAVQCPLLPLLSNQPSPIPPLSIAQCVSSYIANVIIFILVRKSIITFSEIMNNELVWNQKSHDERPHVNSLRPVPMAFRFDSFDFKLSHSINIISYRHKLFIMLDQVFINTLNSENSFFHVCFYFEKKFTKEAAASLCTLNTLTDIVGKFVVVIHVTTVRTQWVEFSVLL